MTNKPQPIPQFNERDIARFWSKVEKTENCWIWKNKPGSSGYGIFNVGRRSRYLAHRVSLSLIGASLPQDFNVQIDHICKNRLCVRPDHLEVVSLRENILRGNSITAQNARKTHCKRGHLLTEIGMGHRGRTRRGCLVCRGAYYGKSSQAGGKA